jgi:hypothetical protein
MAKMDGGCTCENLRYSATGEPDLVAVYNCTDCQRQTGSAFLEFVVVKDEQVKITGESQTFTIKGDSGRTLTRKFCPRCASIIALNTESHPGETLITGGTLDDTKWLQPTAMLFTKSAQPWLLTVGHQMERFEGMPPE